MNFIENILSKLGLNESLAPLKYRAVIFGESGLFIENVKSIVSFSNTEILVRLKKGEILIKGEDLKVKNYTGFDLYILGKVKEFLYRWKAFLVIK